MKNRFIKLVYFLLGIALVITQRTDADLFDQEVVSDNLFTASKLDLIVIETANHLPKSTLFQVSGMVPYGFQVESLAINNQSTFPVAVDMTVNSSSYNDLCANLTLIVLKDWQVIYEGSLLGFAHQSLLKSDQKDAYVFSISLNSAERVLQSQSCSFEVFIRSSTDPSLVLYFDEEKLQNQVSSGTWQ